MKVKSKLSDTANNYLKHTKKQKGITLIALVITIIVLLILAGVTIATLTGDNGILTKAQEASDKTKQANAEEQVKLAVQASYGEDGKINLDELNNELSKIEGLTYKGNPISDSNKIESLPADVVVDGYTITINEDGSVSVGNNETGGGSQNDIVGKYYEEDEDITVGGKPVTIPGGATVSGIEGEYESVDDGFVIYITNGNTITDWSNTETIQQTYDQFVWVPVENAILDLSGNSTALESDDSIKEAVQSEIEAGRYPMAIKKDETNYIGVLYDFEEETDTEGNKYVIVTPNSSWKPISTTSENREPAYLSNSSYADGSSNNNVGITETSLQEEFNTMVTKVTENKGFWVGRYETSNMVNDNAQDATNQITVIKGTTTGINNVNWYRMYAQQKSYSNLALTNSTSTTSSMIWGSQWDQIMIWMKEVKNTVNTDNGEYYVTNAVGMGNYGVADEDAYGDTSNPAATGCYDVKNIYDLAGNIYDWTLEAFTTSNRVLRRRQLLSSV